MVTPTFLNPAIVDPQEQSQRARVSREQFLNILVAQLQNQNPMEPMDNSEFLGQLAQMEQLSTSSELQDTLSGMSKSQGLLGASNLIGKFIKAIDPDTGESLFGKVDSVSLTGDRIEVKVAGKSIALGNITEVIDPQTITPNDGQAPGA